MVNEGIFLGHKLCVRFIEVDKAKVDAIEKMPCPKDIKCFCSFLGHAGFYTLVCVGAIQTVFNPIPRRHLEPLPSE